MLALLFPCSKYLSIIWLSNLFDYEGFWWRLCHKRVLPTKVDIYVFTSLFLCILFLQCHSVCTKGLIQNCLLKNVLEVQSNLWDKKRWPYKTGDSYKRFNSYEIFSDQTRKMWPFNMGYCLIEVTSWAGLIILRKIKNCETKLTQF